MISRHLRRPLWVSIFPCVAVLALLGGCASEPGSAGAKFPAALTSRWSPPAFATRPVDGEARAVIDACVLAANGGGYAVQRFDGASGRVEGARRQASDALGARQDTLEVRVTALAPGVVQVAVVLREVVESAGADERGHGSVSSGLVRDRAPYDAFFERLNAALSSPASPPSPAPAP